MTRPARGRIPVPREKPAKRIDSSTVRYPGLDHPALGDEYAAWREGGRQLRPARDTGLAVEGRLSRERRARERRQRRVVTIASAVAIVTVIIAATVWQTSSDRRASQTPLAEGSSTASATPAAWSHGQPVGDAQMRAVEPSANPTPYFARYDTLKLRVPVRPADLTEIGFHQASYPYALHMKSLLPRMDGSEVKADKSTHRDLSKQDSGLDAILTGFVFRMWRNRPGEPDSAVDVGAAPGSDVYAPVSGTVVKVKRYKLYGRIDDYELHIRPKGYSTVDVVMIHISDVVVRPGDDVVAGVSKLGLVRKLSDKENLQLGEYTRGGGNHTHMQLNDITNPNYEGLEGAVPPNN